MWEKMKFETNTEGWIIAHVEENCEQILYVVIRPSDETQLFTRALVYTRLTS